MDPNCKAVATKFQLGGWVMGGAIRPIQIQSNFIIMLVKIQLLVYSWLVTIVSLLFFPVLLVLYREPEKNQRGGRSMSNQYHYNRLSLLYILTLLILLSSSNFLPSVLAKSRNPITDSEIKKKKSECYADIESGLWGGQCRSSSIAKENCALKCLSPACYELIYESDPLEEGEKDFIRSQEYKYCMYKLSIGESLEGVRGTFD